MFTRKFMIIAAGVALCVTPLAGATASADSPGKVVTIEGADSLKPTRISSTPIDSRPESFTCTRASG